MKVDILASGSSGNCIAVRSANTTVLVDAGIAKTKIEKRLLDVSIKPTSIAAIFVTHAHADHIKGLPIANKYKIPVYAGQDEWKSMTNVEPELQAIKRTEKILELNDLFVDAFRTHHDAFDPHGYTIRDRSGNKVSVCLDTGHIDDLMIRMMLDSTIYVIESNHEPKMVEASQYPSSVKSRVLSDVGHLSNLQAAEALSRLVKGQGEQIYLTHLSSKNNLPALAEMTVVRALLKKGFKKDKDYKIEVFS
ncbi:MAG: MBL fold metallo-hydrolase [Heyndrickxia coagulans]|jgi:phosphoribosyl 1,2-cyclic phosphodiesterase